MPPGQAASVAEVVERLRRVGAGLGADDGVGHFNRLYLLVTERVGERLSAHAFVNPAFLERLDVVFAGLYLEAVDAGDDRRSEAWTPLFESRAATGVVPLQFALAGMNAHINHDLAVATVRACRQLGLSPTSPGVLPDYLTINAVLAEVHEEVRQSLLGETELRARPGGVAGAHPGRLVERQPGPRCGLAAGTGPLGAAVQPDPDPVLPADPGGERRSGVATAAPPAGLIAPTTPCESPVGSMVGSMGVSCGRLAVTASPEDSPRRRRCTQGARWVLAHSALAAADSRRASGGWAGSGVDQSVRSVSWPSADRALSATRR